MYDFTSIFDYKITEKSYIDAMFFSTNDYFSYEQNESANAQNWQGISAKLGWKIFLSEKLNLYSWAYSTSTKSAQRSIRYDDSNMDIRKSQLGIESKITELSLNTKLAYNPNEKININAGFSLQKCVFVPTNEKYVSSGMDIINQNKSENHTISFFGETFARNTCSSGKLLMEPNLFEPM